MKPLNELLYRRLRETFGNVQVVNYGSPIKLHYRPDWLYRKGRLKAEVLDYGETYKVNCPFCSDTRQRLWINHHWGVTDDETRDDMLHLVHCFNEDCVNNRDAQKELHAMVFPKGVHAQSVTVRIKPQKITAPLVSSTIQLPPHTPLTSLPKNHPAIRYLVERHFDPAELAKRWGVCFCPTNEHIKPHFAKGRIAVPVYGVKKNLFADKDAVPKRILAGWQARTLDPHPPKRVPKYLTAAGMKKSSLLYGLPQAIESQGPVIIVEGVTDVWRAGPGAVALFGKSISPVQIKLLLRHVGKRPIVVLLDHDAEAEAKKVCEQIRQARAELNSAPVLVGKLPAKRKDPGECSSAELGKSIKTLLKWSSIGVKQEENNNGE